MFYLYLALIPVLLYVIIKTRNSFHMLQQNLYNENNRYGKWMIKNIDRCITVYDVVLILLNALIFFIPFNYVFIILLISYAYVFYQSYLEYKKEDAKIKFKITKRVRRLIYTTVIIYLIPLVLFYVFRNDINIGYAFILMSLMSFFTYFLVFVINIVNYPIERCVFYYYYNKAKNKLKSMKNMKVVGITGSYGKTTCKNVLADILNVRYNAHPTPKSINTYNGLMMVINNQLDKFDDIFIAELGAYVVGEIKGLCKLVGPKYGILTKIGQAHLATFKSQENIQKAKFELIESLPSDGVAVLNADDELQVNYKLKNKVKKLWYGINNKDADVIASDIEYSRDGMIFNVTFKGVSKKQQFKTSLLGEANIYNILSAITLGYEFGMTIDELKRGVNSVRSVEHRLEFKKMGDINIIDDAYNSNPIGSKMALDVLKLMPGTKIVVTPGMIELGEKQEELNTKFGEFMADVADSVILVGEEQTKPIYEGLLKKKYDKKNIYVLNDVKKAFPLIQKLKGQETYVLLENDLPDIFKEKE